jgi:hypothetical protein
MSNFALLASGQMVGNAAAQNLPATVPASPANLGGVRGEGVRVNIGCLKASTTSIFYGSSNAVTASNGKEVPPGSTETITVNDTAEIWFFAAATATLTWAAFNNG